MLQAEAPQRKDRALLPKLAAIRACLGTLGGGGVMVGGFGHAAGHLEGGVQLDHGRLGAGRRS